MPQILVILFWLWVASSVVIYISRAFKKASGPKADADEAGDAEHEDLALDDPGRWAGSADGTPAEAPATEPAPATISPVAKPKPVATQPVAAQPVAAQPVPAQPVAAQPAVPQHEVVQPAGAPSPEPAPAASMADIAARLEPVEPPAPAPPAPAVPSADDIEPSVLAAMSPEHRAQLASGSPAPASGGLFDASARSAVLQSTQSFDTKPLAELLAGIAMPAGLIPSPAHEASETAMVFTTTSASAPEVAALLGAELERLGFEVKAQPPAGALAVRDGSAVSIGIGSPEPTDEDAPATPAVEATLTSL